MTTEPVRDAGLKLHDRVEASSLDLSIMPGIFWGRRSSYPIGISVLPEDALQFLGVVRLRQRQRVRSSLCDARPRERPFAYSR